MGCGCSAACDGCSRAALRDPHALMLQAEQSGHGAIGDLLPKIVGPSDVAKLKRDLDPAMVATDGAVRACPELDPANRAAWGAFFLTWGAYRDDWDSILFFGAANRYDEGIAFQGELSRWQELLRTRCKVPGPAVVDPHANDEGQASVVKWAAAAVIAVAVVWGVRSVVR